MRTFWLGVLVAVLAFILFGALIAWSGVVGVAASRATPLADRVLDWAATRSLRHHAPDKPNPLASTPEALKQGRAHYREMCVDCHGGPGAKPEEFAAGLHPAAPDLASSEIQGFTDGMLYSSIAGGIHSTAMPSFERTHTPEEIWAIVAYVRSLPREGSSAADAGAAPSGPGAGHEIRIVGSRYLPPSLEVDAGEVVVFTNGDFISHTATADDGSFDTGRINANESKRVTPQKTGTFPYSCRFHHAMRGTLIVR